MKRLQKGVVDKLALSTRSKLAIIKVFNWYKMWSSWQFSDIYLFELTATVPFEFSVNDPKNGVVSMSIAQLGTCTLPVVVIESRFPLLALVKYLLPPNDIFLVTIHFWILSRFAEFGEFSESHLGKTQLSIGKFYRIRRPKFRAN